MKNITVQYGINSLTREVSSDMTFGSLKRDQSFRAGLGYGDNVDTLVSGVSMPNEAIIPNGSVVRIETACNSKA